MIPPLEHIRCIPEAVNIYGCIEFNAEFWHIDVACEIAFLTMDLNFNHRPDLAPPTSWIALRYS
jgi:aminoglycoside phosphotransferase family enzyme